MLGIHKCKNNDQGIKQRTDKLKNIPTNQSTQKYYFLVFKGKLPPPPPFQFDIK